MPALRLLSALLLLVLASAAAPPAKPPPAFPAKVYVMRHLHKAAGEDPPLSAQGAAAARRLAKLLASEAPVALYVTPYRRTRETAAPLAAALKLQPKEYDPRDSRALMERVAREKGTVLIVGHSNTVPEIVDLLGGARPPELGEQDYGDLFLVEGPARRVIKRNLLQMSR